MIARFSIAVVAACLLDGCAASTKTTGDFQVPAAQYAAAFDASREALLGRRFELERVDARAGVITTREKTTAGLATPWDTEQSGLDQEVEDLFNRHQRRVRITFEPVGGVAADGAGQPDDLRIATGELTARVEVVIERLHRPGWRIEPGAVRFSTYAEDPALGGARGMWPSYAVPFSQDPALAERIAAEIETQLKPK